MERNLFSISAGGPSRISFENFSPTILPRETWSLVNLPLSGVAAEKRKAEAKANPAKKAKAKSSAKTAPKQEPEDWPEDSEVAGEADWPDDETSGEE